MKTRVVLGLLAAVVLAGGGYLVGTRNPSHSEREPARIAYRCPMHPHVVSDKPGNCPICSMKLVRFDSSAPAPPVAGDASVTGRVTIALTPEKRQLLGLRSELVREAEVEHTIRTVGRVTVDERRVHHVHTKYDGYVEKLYVDFTGKFVKRGEPLLSIYSPDLVATQQEYLLALRAQREFDASGAAGVARGGQGLLEAARQRLLFWDIETSDIERIGASGQVLRTLDLHAEMSGYVTQKMAFHGMRVTPMDILFDMADLSHLWVLADIYESDLPAVRVGMQGELSVPYEPGRVWRGPVTYIAPTVEEKTRTVKVRIEIDNVGDRLKPEMFADVLLRAALGKGLIVADDAIVNAGDRKLVFLDRADGTLVPREVVLGPKVGGGSQVLQGLAAGDRVVTSANFLLDSESSLKAALFAMSPAPASPSPRQ